MGFSLIITSLQVATLATAINVPFAMFIGWLLIKRNFRGKFILDILVSLPMAVPPVAIGFLLLLLFGRNGPVGSILYNLLGIEIVFTLIAAALAAAIVSFPLMTRTIMVAFGEVDERMELSARTLGASPWKVAFTITIPLAYKGILAGILIGFVRSISEFGATIVVAGNIPGYTQTLPTAIYTSVQTGDHNVAVRLVFLSISLAVVALLAHNYLLRRTRL